MGMFDSIYVYMQCPLCKQNVNFEAQTKDLSNHMFTYKALSVYVDDKGKSKNAKKFADIERKMRKKLPVFPSTPYDKEHKVWKNQWERMITMAKVPKKYADLKYVKIVTHCESPKCVSIIQEEKGHSEWFDFPYFTGRIMIKDGLLRSPIKYLKRMK